MTLNIIMAWLYAVVVSGIGIFVLMRIFLLGMDKIILLAWAYIFGVVLATIYTIPIAWVPILFKSAYALIAIYIVFLLMKKDKVQLFPGAAAKIIGYIIAAALFAASFLLLKPMFVKISVVWDAILAAVLAIVALYIIGVVFSTAANNRTVNIQKILILIIGIALGLGVYTGFLDTSVPNHIVNFTQDGYDIKSRIVGRVVAEPVYKPGKVVYTIKPTEVQPNIYEDKVVKVQGRGHILFQASGSLMHQLDINYGDRVELRGSLLRPRAANNPGGFDYREFLKAQGVYGAMYARYANSSNPPIQKLESYIPEPVFKNIVNFKYQYFALFKFSLLVKDKMLRVIKQTLPFPESAFVGGVTLGLRYGLTGIHFGNAKATVSDEFKHSGVNHVLAVSGLHVTIIAAMLWAIFSIFRVPIKVQAPVIILALVVFTIITGARPATLRAAIMNSLIVLTLAYLGQGLRSSLIFGISVAALLILLFNPLLIYQASFTMSFGALLSLGLLTGPVDTLLQKYLVGEAFIASIIYLVAIVLVMYIFKESFTIIHFYLAGLVGLIVIAVTYRFRSGKMDSFSFIKLPRGIGGFVASQFAIGLGMMLPSSYNYFGQYPIAGSFANFIAIPLIGIVVPLGMIAGIVAMLIPFYGIWIALVISAGNWLFSILFLWIAHISTLVFPYPVTTKWPISKLLLFYVALLVFIWWRPLSRKIQQIYYSLTDVYDIEKNKWLIIVVALAVLIGAAGLIFYNTKPKNELKVVVLDAGYAGGKYIKFPSGKTVLIDSALNDKRKGFNAGQRTVSSTLLKDHVQTLEAIVLTNPERQNISGLIFILEHYDVKEVFDSVYTPELNTIAAKYIAMKKKYDSQRQKYISFLENLMNYDVNKNKKKYGADELDRKIEELEILGEEKEVLNDKTDAMKGDIDKMHDKLDAAKEEFLSYFEDENILNNIKKWWVQSYIDNYIEYLDIINKKHITITRAHYGDVIYSEKVGNKTAQLYVLSPREPYIDGSYSDLRNNGVIVRLVYGKFSMLFPGEVDYPALNKLVSGAEAGDYSLKSTVLMIPNHGSKFAYSENFLNAVDPKTVVLQYGSANSIRGRRFGRALSTQMKHTKRSLRAFNPELLFFNTYDDGAITIITDGETTRYKTMSDVHRAEANKLSKKKLPAISHLITDRVMGKLNINTATAEQLMKLPRIGYTKARDIVEHRKELGGYTSVDQLTDIKGIGPKTVDKFRDMVTVGDSKTGDAKADQRTEKNNLY